MKYRTLGRTGLEVSIIGIGGGGPTQLGQKTGVGQDGVDNLVRRALDLGINFFDTSAAYGESETILGRALKGIPRDEYILATKFHPAHGGKGDVVTPDDVVFSVEQSLERLQVDYVDVMQWHGVRAHQYHEAIENLGPTVDKLKDQGKFRFIGITETYAQDPKHEMFSQALKDDLFDTAMVGYNLLSPTPEHEILPKCQELNIGVIGMVAVRRALSRPDHLKEQIARAVERGLIAKDAFDSEDPLGWLVRDHVTSLPSAGYKYVNAHPAMSVVLSGTANIDHLEENVKSILGPPLPDEDMARLRSVFGDIWEPLGN